MKVVRISRRCWAALLLTSSSAWADPDPNPPVDPSAPVPTPRPSVTAQSQPASTPPTPASPAAGSAAAASRNAAAAAFNRGNLLLDKGARAEALAEYVRAYELSPAYQVLYNIGGLNVQLQRWANARRAYELYLKLGGPAVSPARTAEVRGYLDELSRKTATLTLTLNVPGAEVHVDGAPVESTAVTGLILEPGEHVVRVSKPGFKPLEQLLRATDGENVHLVLPLARMNADEPALPSQNPFAVTPLPRVETTPNDVADERVPLWIPWTITGALAVGWMTTAGLAIKARHDRNIIERPETSEARIDDARRLHETLAVVSDVLLVSTLASAGVSAYLTWWPKSDPGVSPGSAGARAATEHFAVGVFGQF
jgi:PEGA domain